MWNSEIVSGKELESAKRERSKAFIFRNEVEEAKNRFIDEGWEWERDLANRKVKLRKPKSEKDRFENRVWLMLHSLGFSQMNASNNFEIPYTAKGTNTKKQIDVFAVDEETILVVECKVSDNPGKRNSFKSTVEAISGYRNGACNTIATIFPNKKIIFILATCGYIVGDADKAHMHNLNIQYFDESTIEYYEALGKHLGKSARYQLLGNLFAGKPIKGMDTSVAAIKGKMGGHEYYSFSIEPAKLLKMCYVLHRNNAQPEEVLPTYQRLIKKSRLKDIQSYINDGGYFPNSIIVSVDEKKASFDAAPKENQPADSNSRIGILRLPKKYRSIYVIDGQHRLYGYADSKYEKSDIIPVVAFYNLNNTEQIKMFMDINEKQKAVPKTLRTTLNSDLLWDAEDMSDKQKALRSRIAQQLGERKQSPLYDRIIVGENTKTPTRTITLPFIDEAIAQSSYLGKYRNGEMEQTGLFEYANIEKSYDRLLPYLEGCFESIKSNALPEWGKSDKEGAIFTINVGVSACIRLFSDILESLHEQGECDPKNDSISDLVEHTGYYIQPLIDFVSNLNNEQRADISKSYGGKGPKDCWRKFQEAVRNVRNDFNPSGLEEWIRDNNKQFNADAENSLQRIENKITQDFRRILETHYGQNWLRNGLDRPVYNALLKRVSDAEYETDQTIDPWSLVSLEECRRIATWSQNWTKLFRDYFSSFYPNKKPRSKAEATRWLSDLHTIRRDMGKYRNYSVSLENYKTVRAAEDMLFGQGHDHNTDYSILGLEIEDSEAE